MVQLLEKFVRDDSGAASIECRLTTSLIAVGIIDAGGGVGAQNCPPIGVQNCPRFRGKAA